MNGLIDIRQIITQILGFLIMLWVLRRFAWAPVLKMLEDRRQKIAGEFAEAERRQAAADQRKAKYEADLKGIEALSRQKLQEAVAEGQKVASEIKSQAHADAAARVQQAQDEIAREQEKAKEILKEKMIALSLRAAEKVIRTKLDDAGHRKLISEFLDEAGAAR